ncbi:MAG: hypothetical protein GC150_15360 [Rhizobiales bacterium]|nr:hypothetical protein [Hyphomicrobiales bacterium]
MSAPTVTQIRGAIAAKIAAVAGVGKVHAFERYAKGESDLRSMYVTDGVLAGWYVRRIATRELSPHPGRSIVWHRWRLGGFKGLLDAETTEIAFDETVEAIRAAFRVDDTLGGLVTTCTEPEGDGALAGVQLDDSGPVMFCGVLCHAARLSLSTRHHL